MRLILLLLLVGLVVAIVVVLSTLSTRGQVRRLQARWLLCVALLAVLVVAGWELVVRWPLPALALSVVLAGVGGELLLWASLWFAECLLRRADGRAEAGTDVYAIDTSSATASYAQELRRQGVGSLTLATCLKQQFLLPSLTRSHLVWEMFPESRGAGED